MDELKIKIEAALKTLPKNFRFEVTEYAITVERYGKLIYGALGEDKPKWHKVAEISLEEKKVRIARPLDVVTLAFMNIVMDRANVIDFETVEAETPVDQDLNSENFPAFMPCDLPK